MPLKDHQRTVWLPLPHLIEAGRATTIYAPVYAAGALVAPTGGGASTVQIVKADGTDLVAAGTVVVSGSIGEYTVGSGDTSTTDLSEAWRVVWTLAVGSDTVVASNDAAVVRRRLYPVVSDVDLYRRVRSLDPQHAATITTASSYQDPLDEAWAEIQRRLYARGNRPNLIQTPSSLRECHLLLALALIFEDLAARQDTYAERALSYREQWEDAWNGLSFQYSTSDGTTADSTHERRSAEPTVWLAGRAATRARWLG